MRDINWMGDLERFYDTVLQSRELLIAMEENPKISEDDKADTRKHVLGRICTLAPYLVSGYYIQEESND